MKHKYIYIISLVAILSFILCSCTASLEAQDNNKPKIIAVSFIQYDLTRQISKDKVDLNLLIKPGAEMHTFEPTPMDLAKISTCDLLIRNGGISESWLDTLLVDMQNINSLKFMDYARLLYSHNHDEDSGSFDNHSHEIDEHVWTSPKNAILIANAICNSLIKIDPDNASFYTQNKNDLVAKLEQLDKEFSLLTSNSQRNVIIVGDRFPFLYLAHDYNIDYYSAFSGCASNIEPNSADIMMLNNKVKNQNIPVVFKIEFSNGAIANSIAEATNAKVLTLHSCHNVTKDDFEKGVDYISLMQQNLKNLREALN